MGSVELIIAKEIADLFKLLGGHIICAAETTGNTKKYHLNRVKLYKQCLLELKQCLYKDTLSEKMFKSILYKWFKNDIEQELICRSDFSKHIVYMSEEQAKNSISKAVEKWLNSESGV